MNEFKRFNKSKLNIEDQWSSHPTTAQRIGTTFDPANTLLVKSTILLQISYSPT